MMMMMSGQVLWDGGTQPHDGVNIGLRGWQPVEPRTAPVPEPRGRPVLRLRRWRHFRFRVGAAGSRRRHTGEPAPRDVTRGRVQRPAESATSPLVSEWHHRHHIYFTVTRKAQTRWTGYHKTAKEQKEKCKRTKKQKQKNKKQAVRVATQYAFAPCKLTISSYLFARWHLLAN